MALPKSISMKEVGFFGYDDTNNRWQALEIDSNGNLKVALSASASIDIGDVQIKNVAGTLINPATEEKQDDAIAFLLSIETYLDSIEGATGDPIIDPTPETILGRLKTIADQQIDSTQKTRLVSNDGSTVADIVQDSTYNALFVRSESLATETTLASMVSDIAIIAGTDFAIENGNLSILATAFGTIADAGNESLSAMGLLDMIAWNADTYLSAIGEAIASPTVNTLADRLKTIATNQLPSGHNVTANAGTNLNTSLLAIEEGGNLEAIATYLSTIDVDTGNIATSLGLLDNSIDGNYLNVNLNIAGTDVAAGAGVVNAQTQRVTHASNDPVTTALQIIDNFISGSRGLVTEDNSNAIKTAVEIMDDWDDADRAKMSERLIKSVITDTTVDSTADLIFDASGDTDAVELTISNPATTILYVGEDASVTVSDFMYYIPPKQTIVIKHAGNSGTTEDLYGIRDSGNSGLCKVYSRKYK